MRERAEARTASRGYPDGRAEARTVSGDVAAEEWAFPRTSINYENFLGKIELDKRFSEIGVPFLLDPWRPIKVPTEILGRQADSRIIKENVQNYFWNEWLASIDRLLARVQDILNMKLAATEWATDASELADDFLRTADEFLKDDSETDQEQRDLVAEA